VASSPKTCSMARLNAGHSSGVAGRRPSAGSVTGAVYPGSPTVRERVPENGVVAGTRSWAEMLTGIEERLVAATGDDVATWSRRVRETGLDTEPEVRAWLAGQGVTGYGQMVLVMERFGYPEFLTATADELVDAQYADRPQLRPVLDAVLAAASGVGEGHVQVRKGYVSLVGPRRTYAVVQASTVRLALTTVSDVDDEVVALLAEAHAANR
jgi:hypothetical protein